MPATQPSPAVADLIRQLADDSFPVRDAAQQKLAAMDPAVEGELRGAIAAGLGPEAKSRASALADQFRDQRYYGRTWITIHAKDAPLADVLKSFTAQAGAPMGTDARGFADAIASRRVTLELNHADFWDSLKQISDAGQMTLSYDANQQLQFMPDRVLDGLSGALTPAFSNLAATFGPLRIAPLSGAPGTLILHLYSEPKIRPIPAACHCLLQSCIDDLGTSHRFTRDAPQVPANTYWMHYCLTDRPADAATKLADFKAEYRLELDTHHETFDFSDLATKPGQTHPTANGNISISQLTVDATGQKITLTANLSSGAASLGSIGGGKVQFTNPPCSFSFLSDTGEVAMPTQTALRGGVAASVTLTFPPNTNLRKVHCDISSDQRTLSVPIEFHDIPLVPGH